VSSVADPTPLVVVLSGAGGGVPDPAIFRAGIGDRTRYETVGYPGWRRYIEEDFSTEVLVAELAAKISAIASRGPIRIIGISIGGHFGYAAALHLKASGREIAGFCAIDTFMVSTAAPSAGWQGRALALASRLIRGRRFGEFFRFLRSRFWRALFRLAGRRLPNLLRKVASSRQLSWIFSLDPIFEEELNIRLLIQWAAPWIASLDRKPVALDAPAVLLRTRFTARDDAAWRCRCPDINLIEIPGDHQGLFERENISSLHDSFVIATQKWR
jgi:thioesterase domain-containing protein